MNQDFPLFMFLLVLYVNSLIYRGALIVERSIKVTGLHGSIWGSNKHNTAIKVKHLRGWRINKFLNKMSSLLYRPERKSNVWWFKSPIKLAFKLDWGKSKFFMWNISGHSKGMVGRSCHWKGEWNETSDKVYPLLSSIGINIYLLRCRSIFKRQRKQKIT